MTEKPGFVLTLKAKPGRGAELRELMATGIAGTDAIESHMICSVDGEPDTFMVFEFFKDQETLDAHEARPTIDEEHKSIFDVLGDPPSRVSVHAVAGS